MDMVTTFVFLLLGGARRLLMRLQLGARTHAGQAAVYNQLVHDARPTYLPFIVP